MILKTTMIIMTMMLTVIMGIMITIICNKHSWMLIIKIVQQY